jgi:chromosome segregation ATPase
MDHDVWLRFERLDRRLAAIERKIDAVLVTQTIEQMEITNMTKELNDLTAQVKANTDAEASAVTLIQGLAAQIAAAQNDPAAIAALSAQLKTSADALAAAVVANTPSAPPA